MVLAAGDEVRTHDALLVVDRPHPLPRTVVHDTFAGALPAVGGHRRRIAAGRGHRRQRRAPAVGGAGRRRRRVDHERLVAGPDAEDARRLPSDDAVVLQVLAALEVTDRGLGRHVEGAVDGAGVEAGGRERLLHALHRRAAVVESDGGDGDGAPVEFDRRLGDDLGGRNDHRRHVDGIGGRRGRAGSQPGRRAVVGREHDPDAECSHDGDAGRDDAPVPREWISWWDRILGSVGVWRPCIGWEVSAGIVERNAPWYPPGSAVLSLTVRLFRVGGPRSAPVVHSARHGCEHRTRSCGRPAAGGTRPPLHLRPAPDREQSAGRGWAGHPSRTAGDGIGSRPEFGLPQPVDPRGGRCRAAAGAPR